MHSMFFVNPNVNVEFTSPISPLTLKYVIFLSTEFSLGQVAGEFDSRL